MVTKIVFALCFICLTSIVCFGQENFDNLANAFNDKAVTSLGNESIETSDSLSVYVAKKTVRNAVETTFNKAQINISANFRKPVDVHPEPVKINWKVDCPPAEPCKTCDEHCGFFNATCKAREAACEVGRKFCLLEKGGKHLICEGTKLIANRLDGLEIGQFHGQDIEFGGLASTTPLSVNLKDDLTEGELNAENINARVTFKGKVAFHMTLATNVAAVALVTSLLGPSAITCPATTQIPIEIPETEVVEIEPKRPINFKINFDRSISESPDGMNLKLSVQNAEIEIKVPIVKILARTLNNNRTRYLTCLDLALPIAFAGIEDNTFFPLPPITIDTSIQKDLLSFDIGQINIALPGQEAPFILIPKSNALSLGVTEKK